MPQNYTTDITKIPELRTRIQNHFLRASTIITGKSREEKSR